jgi:hypothetical protein
MNKLFEVTFEIRRRPIWRRWSHNQEVVRKEVICFQADSRDTAYRLGRIEGTCRWPGMWRIVSCLQVDILGESEPNGETEKRKAIEPKTDHIAIRT